MYQVYGGHEYQSITPVILETALARHLAFIYVHSNQTLGRKPMRRRGITKILLAVLIAFCAAVTPARGAELIPLRATYASIGGAFAPLWIAQDKGVFNKYGLP